MKLSIVVVLAGIVGLGLSCSLKSVDHGNQITIRLEDHSSNFSNSGVSGQSLLGTPPTSLAGFDCIGVNVMGPGIPDTSPDPEPDHDNLFNRLLNQESFCSYRGLLAGPLTVNANTAQEITLVVPPGAPRLIQIVGLKERNGSNDCYGEFANLPGPSPTPGGLTVEADAFELGRAVVNLFQDQTVSISPDWNSLSAATQVARSIKCKSSTVAVVGDFSVGPQMSVARGDPAVYLDTRIAPTKIWVTGGVSPTVETLEPSALVWTSMGSMAYSAKGAILTAGPSGSTSMIRVGGLPSTTNTSSTYNGSMWGTESALGGNFAYSAPVFHSDGNTYFFGGINGASPFGNYGKVVSGAFTSGTLPGPSFGRAAAAEILAGAFPQKIVVAGGVGSTASIDNCYLYTPLSTLAACGANLPGTAHDAALVAVSDGTAYHIGGAVLSMGTTSYRTTVYQSNVAYTAWTAVAPMATARSEFKAFPISSGTKILVIGGKTGPVPSDVTATTEVYDIATDSWSAGPSLNTARYGYGAVQTADGKIYIFGGYGSGGAELSSVEIYTP